VPKKQGNAVANDILNSCTTGTWFYSI